jgi:hypothetical protein
MKDSLIFEWPGRHHLHLLLPFTILLAAILHAGLFFVFSISYPRPENTHPDPARVFFVPPGTADAERLESLVRSSDPAVCAPGRGLDLPPAVPPVAYNPKYLSDSPVLAPLPPGIKSDTPHRSFAGPVPVRRESPKASGNSPARVPTRLLGSEPLAGRIPDLPENSVFPVPRGTAPEPAVFFIAVGSDGKIRHLFLQRSSGIVPLDSRAANLLRSTKFSSDPAPESWGFVSFQWGTDVEPVSPP